MAAGGEEPLCSFDFLADDGLKAIFDSEEDKEDETSCVIDIAESTEKARKRALAAWDRYRGWVSRKYQTCLHLVEFWIDVVKNDRSAKEHCKKFLRLYVKASKRKRLTLGPEEFVIEQGVKICRSVNAFWKALIAAADAAYLLPKRDADKENYWTMLKRPKNYPGWADEGPTMQVSQWIYNEGARLMNLTKGSDYERVEMAARDTGRFLKTLWECADDIPVQKPIHRVIFHALVLLFTCGGFHQGMIMGPGCLKFRDISVGLARDPENPDRRRPMAEPTIKRNKLRRNALEHKKGTEFSFSTTLLPTPIFCLASLIAARGVQAGAFEDDFLSCEELINRPQFEDGIDWIPLDWKESMLDEPGSPMSWSTFSRIFRRCLLVMGCKKDPRVYAFRVGAGADLDGCLSPALRNFVISQSTDVYENNYMTERVRVNLAYCRLKDLAGSSERLFEIVRDVSLQRDPGAPIDLNEDQLRYTESRNDTTKLTAKHTAAKESGDAKKLKQTRAALELHKRQVGAPLIQKARTDYFAKTESLRRRAQPTTDLRRPESEGPRKHSNLDMKALVKLWTETATTWAHADILSQQTMDWMVHYMAHTPGKVATYPAKKSTEEDVKLSRRSQMSACFLLLCDLPVKIFTHQTLQDRAPTARGLRHSFRMSGMPTLGAQCCHDHRCLSLEHPHGSDSREKTLPAALQKTRRQGRLGTAALYAADHFPKQHQGITTGTPELSTLESCSLVRSVLPWSPMQSAAASPAMIFSCILPRLTAIRLSRDVVSAESSAPQEGWQPTSEGHLANSPSRGLVDVSKPKTGSAKRKSTRGDTHSEQSSNSGSWDTHLVGKSALESSVGVTCLPSPPASEYDSTEPPSKRSRLESPFDVPEPWETTASDVYTFVDYSMRF